MPKAPPRLNPHDPVQGLALEMRSLRLRAGNPSLAELGRAMSCSHSTVSAYLNGRRVPPPDQLKTFVLACKDDPAPWQEKLETVHERLSRLPAPDASRTATYEHCADVGDKRQGTNPMGTDGAPGTMRNGPERQESPERLSRRVFGLSDPITSEMCPDDAAARLRRAFRGGHRITTLHPRTCNEARTVGEHFREGTPVIMNLTEMTDSDAKRLVDFSAGLTFGLRGSIDRVTNKVLLLSPANIEATVEDDAGVTLEMSPEEEEASLRRASREGGDQITTVHPRTYSDVRAVGEHFREGTLVIMNLTEMGDSDAKRLVDFAAGLIFGLRGSIDRVTNKVFLLSPASIEVTVEDKARMAERDFFTQS